MVDAINTEYTTTSDNHKGSSTKREDRFFRSRLSFQRMSHNKFIIPIIGATVAGAAVGAYFLYKKWFVAKDSDSEDDEIIPKTNKELVQLLKRMSLSL
jgi:hypothetical protein